MDSKPNEKLKQYPSTSTENQMDSKTNEKLKQYPSASTEKQMDSKTNEKSKQCPNASREKKIKKLIMNTKITRSLIETFNYNNNQEIEKKISIKDAKLLIDLLEGKKEIEEMCITEKKVTEDFRKMLLQIIANGLSLPPPTSLLDSVIYKNHLLTPRIISHLELLHLTTEQLFYQIEGDQAFVILSLIMNIDSEYFREKDKNVITIKYFSNKENLYSKLKNRVKILDDLTRILRKQKSEMNLLIGRIIYAAIYSIKISLFNIMLKYFSIYSDTILDKPVDVSFFSSMINTDNFSKVTALVEKDIITFFGYKPQQRRKSDQCDDYDDLLIYSAPTILERDYDRNVLTNSNDDYAQTRIEKFNKKRSKLGIFWKHKRRNNVLRNHILTSAVNEVLEALIIISREENNNDGDVEEEGLRLFEKLITRLDSQNIITIIESTHWNVPISVLQGVFHKVIFYYLRTYFYFNNVYDRAKHWNKIYDNAYNYWDKEYFGSVTIRIIEAIGFDAISVTDMDNALQIMLTKNCVTSFMYIINNYAEKFSVKRIKDMILFIIISEMVSVENIPIFLVYMIFKYPWLLNTWIDNDGNTLLCLCIYNNHTNNIIDWAFKKRIYDVIWENILKNVEIIIKNHINVECKNGINPLFFAADVLDSEFYSILNYWGADVTHVNRYGESVLHRLAAFNNVEGLRVICSHTSLFMKIAPLIELRRNGDGATALMIALARENLDAASMLMSMGASATTKFGFSQTLRTVEALFLKRKLLSIALLAEKSIYPMNHIIAQSIITGSIFQEECLIATTGLKNIACIYFRLFYEGPVTKRLKRKEKRYYVDLYNSKINDINRYYFKSCKTNGFYKGEPVFLDDLTFYLFNEEREYPNMKWAKLLVKNKIEKEKIIQECVNDFDNEKCPICLGQFTVDNDNDDNFSLMKGITGCGHSFHNSCWKALQSDKCPVCRNNTYFYNPGVNTFDVEPVIDIQRTKLRQFRKTKERRRINDNPDVARYSFFIDGVWVDESSSLNILS